MRFLVIACIVVLTVATVPTSVADTNSDHHWNGYVLDRVTVSNHVLINQNYDYYSLQTGNPDVVVVAFIFTTCPDVCPVITSNLVQAEKQLDDVDYQFISITVDPATDSPAVLREYMEGFGATWPHLTAELEDLEMVWKDFGISVLTEEIENHEHEDSNAHNHESSDDSTVMVVMPDGETSSHEVMPTGLDQLTASAYQEDWIINSSYSTWGTFVSGINNDDAPSDYSWWWELHSWNESSNSWNSADVGIDSINVGHLAFAPNSTDDIAIPTPQSDNDTFVIVQSDGTSEISELSEINAWHMSLGALDSFVAPDSDWGHYMTTINGIEAPADYSWWWQLHYWDEGTESWNESSVGMDMLVDKQHIAWAPNSTSDDSIPAPDSYMIHKLGVVYPDGNYALFDNKYFDTNNISAMKHTIQTLESSDVELVTSGADVTSINSIESEYELYMWHDMGSFSHWMSTSDSANESMLIDDASHYAWVANGQDADNLPSPLVDPEEEKNETSTSHSTQTFILDGDWKPKVVFVGYDWDVDLFVEDVRRAANLKSGPGDSDNGLPGFSAVTVITGLGLAIIASSRED